MEVYNCDRSKHCHALNLRQNLRRKKRERKMGRGKKLVTYKEKNLTNLNKPNNNPD